MVQEGRGHIFGVSLHGFPIGMIKSCRRYWTEIANGIVQLKSVRFVNPQYDLKTTFDRIDFTRIMQDTFKIAKDRTEAFFSLGSMDYFATTTEPSGIFSSNSFPDAKTSSVSSLNLSPMPMDPPQGSRHRLRNRFFQFHEKGIYVQGRNRLLIKKMVTELLGNGADLRPKSMVEKLITDKMDGKHHVSGSSSTGRKCVVGRAFDVTSKAPSRNSLACPNCRPNSPKASSRSSKLHFLPSLHRDQGRS